MSIRELIPFRKNSREGSVPAHRRENDPFLRLHDEIDRLFDDFVPDVFRGSRWLEGFAGDQWSFRPQIDVNDEGDKFVVTAELPGVDEKDLDVKVEGQTLTLKGEKREENRTREGAWQRHECCYGTFLRTIPLSDEVDSERAEAKFKKGVLKVTLPKMHQTKEGTQKRIDVKAA